MKNVGDQTYDVRSRVETNSTPEIAMKPIQWQGAACVTVLLAGMAHAADPKRPTVTIENPVAEEQYLHTSNIAVNGTVTPALRTSVDIRIHLVLDDGGLILLGRTEAMPNEQGHFLCNLHPASPGWRPGDLRLTARLSAMPHIRADREIVIPAPAQPMKDWVEYEPRSSGQVVELGEKKKHFFVARNERFLVACRLDAARVGQARLVKIIGIRNRKDVAFESAFVLWLPDGKEQWFETEFVSPDEPGDYRVLLQVPGGPAIEEVRLTVDRDSLTSVLGGATTLR
ncbi:MAG: hypothetical protein WBC44_07100 [Planctomycetaceae bacterium]